MKKILTFFVVASLVGGCGPIKEGGIVQLGDRTSSQKALVIGNSGYDHEPLNNSQNDAVDMAHLLADEMGFHVILATNLNRQGMNRTLRDFRQLLADTQVPVEEKVGLFYFSGHGARSSKDNNYLIPIDNGRIKTEHDLRRKAFQVKQDVLEEMEAVNNGVNLIVADACRDNPYEDSDKSTKRKRGLTRIPPPSPTETKLGALIAFAADNGEVADDGGRRNGLYTKHLMVQMRRFKHKPVEEVFKQVREPVKQESGGTQHPWYDTSLAETYCFGGC
ncbi:MAG: hypothetical protein B6242_11860 [Anaerolineaceae bacterium 4572_78]|nr:MAG: hypothetical protein B6242_11860 [Anaerolineaceae bacterium 4572_78]RKZ73514.1 MAG: hypothetical protein DRQ57_14140 [Gammaproteobacteria bacterium]